MSQDMKRMGKKGTRHGRTILKQRGREERAERKGRNREEKATQVSK